MYQPNRIIVIGGNAAGPAAAAKAKRVNPDAEVILFEANDYISTGTCELPYLLSEEIDNYKKLIFFSPESFEKEKGVKVFTQNQVKSIDPKLKEISVFNKLTNVTKEIEYNKLILATGSIANEIPQLPFLLENVFSLKSINNYKSIADYLKTNKVKNVLIVGSGYIGLETADALSSVGYSVTILEESERPMPNADEEIQHLIMELISKNNIRYIKSEENTKFVISNNKFKQLNNNSRFIDFDMAIVAAGVKPNNWLAKEINLKLGIYDGLTVDSRLKTSNSNIYAAGDNIEVTNFITRQKDYIPLATFAHSFGHIAGGNAAGENNIANSVYLNSAFKFGGKFIAQVGLTQKQAEDNFINSRFVTAVANNKVKVMPESEKVFGKILYDKNSKLVLGGSFVGNAEVSGYTDIIASFISNKISVENLSNINYNYTPPLSPFINILSILGRKIKEKSK